jgi:rhodanese-related sulfurtransferase
MKQIEASELKQMTESKSVTAVIDVRTPMEYNLGHVPNAINIPLHQLGHTLPHIKKDEPVAVICQAGSRSQMACQKLIDEYPNVMNVMGGTSAWASAGLPLEKAPPSPNRVTRQSHFVASVMLIAALYLATTVNPAWMYLAALPAFGLMLDSLTGFCPMSWLLAKMPFNRA